MALGVEVSGPGLHELYAFVTLGAVVFIIYKAGGPAIVEGLKARASGVRDRLFQTQKKLKEVQSSLERARSDLKQIEELRRKMLSSVESDAQKLSEEIMQDAKLQAKRIMEDAVLAANNESLKAVRELRETLINDALAYALSQVGGEKQKSIHTKLVRDLGQDMGQGA